MKFDDILHEIGDFGRYQVGIIAIVSVILFPSSWIAFLQVFAMGASDHWCKIPQWNTTTCIDLGGDAAICEDPEILKSVSIPLVKGTNGSDVSTGHVYSSCERYNVTDYSLLVDGVASNVSMATYISLETEPRGIIPCDAGWDYDRSLYTRTVIEEYDLVCGGEVYVQVAQSFFYGGYLVGSALFGTLADVYGRYYALFGAILLNVLFGYGILAFKSYWFFVLLRFCQGVANVALFIVTFVYVTESVGTTRRNVAGIVTAIPYAVGYMVFAGIAYLVRDWRKMVIAITTPFIPLLLFMLIVPESPRWLISRGRKDEAKKTITKMAAVNKKTLPEDCLSEKLDLSFTLQDDLSDQQKKVNPIDILRGPIRKRTLIAMYLWCVCAVVYHGLSLSTSSLGINVFISFMVSAGMEIPAYALSIFVIEVPWLGRRRTTSITLLVGGGACLLTACIAPGVLRATVAMIGKFGISAGFSIVYLYTAELFPTPLRSIGLGYCSMAGRVANITAPLVLLTSQLWKPAPLVIFGGCTVLAGFLTLLLPETQGRRLPENMQEIEESGRLVCNTLLVNEFTNCQI
ncbi:organic cation transporter protein-like [Diadema setosum]|uniref:organic cation transporter protein-like n=1 Tax=Diadema setosum TaxID=31175 RepID=UPI003B3A76F1